MGLEFEPPSSRNFFGSTSFIDCTFENQSRSSEWLNSFGFLTLLKGVTVGGPPQNSVSIKEIQSVHGGVHRRRTVGIAART